MRKFITFFLLLVPLTASAYPWPCDHPRLLLREGEEEQIRAAIERQPLMATADSVIVEYCNSIMDMAPQPKEMAGFRIKNMADRLNNLFYLSYAWRVHRDMRYADRAIKEMMQIATYDDWNPSHFLDVAEITMGMAIGYDWLYDLLSPSQRRNIAAAIKRCGFDASKDDQKAWFYTAFQNWNQVCNAGLVFGAVALWDEYHEDAVMILDKCFGSNHLTLRSGYSPEGAYAEGYGYWGYGSAFQMLLIAALESAFGSDMDLMKGYDSFYRSGRFMQMMNRPSGLCFDYADSGRLASAEHVMAWLANKTGDNTLLYEEVKKFRKYRFDKLDQKRLLPFFLISARNMELDDLKVPEQNFFVAGGLTPLYIYRSGWESADDSYLGIKAGLNSSNHSHVDVGSFIYDADGVNWSDDLGLQNYLSLESGGVDLWNRWQNSQRYDVFRIGPFSHSIVTVGGHRPDVYQYTDFCRTWTGSGRKGAEMNLKMVYWEDLNAYVRRIELNEDDSVLCVTDSLQARDHPSSVRWVMCTTAAAEIVDEHSIRLTKNGHSRLLVAEADGADPVAALLQAGPVHDYDFDNPDNLIAGFTLELGAWDTACLRVKLIREY